MRSAVRSLQARMLLLSAAVAVVVTVLTGLAIAAVLERFVIQGLDGRLDAELALMASAVDADGRVDRDRLQASLGAFEPRPGWQWSITGPDGALGSADLIATGTPPPPPPPPLPASSLPPPLRDAGPRPFDGRDARGEPLHARLLSIESRRGPVTLLAAAPRSLVLRPIRAAMVPLLSVVAALLALLVAASVVQLRVGLAPVRRLRGQVEAIRVGGRDRVDEDQPAELQPLATELNALAASNEAALKAARDTGANLAHALKTPVAVLALDLRHDPQRSAQVARIDAIIRHHLRRERIATVDRHVATSLAGAVEGLAVAIRHLHADRALIVTAQLDERLMVGMDAQDLEEILGNLLDNAARHARRTVWLEADIDPSDPRRIRIVVADDGPGIAWEKRRTVLERGMRLDERGDGNGFGLAIVVELMSLYGGDIALDERKGGGLTVTMSVPRRIAG